MPLKPGSVSLSPTHASSAASLLPNQLVLIGRELTTGQIPPLPASYLQEAKQLLSVTGSEDVTRRASRDWAGWAAPALL